MTPSHSVTRTLRGTASTAVSITGGAAAAATPLLVAGAAAGPIGAAIGLATTLITALIANSGCGQTCVAATDIVNQMVPPLQANRDAYVNAPQRTPQMQADGLANFDAAWAFLSSSQGCGNPALGNAGKRCLSERDRGGKYSWFSSLRDPIANTPPNASDPNPVTTAAAQLGIPTDFLIAGGLVLIGALL